MAFKDKQFDILSAQVSGKQKELSVKLELDGEAAGSAEIWSNLIFDSATQRLQLEELNFIFEPRDEDIYLAANLFHERIRQALQEVANQWLDTATGQLNQRLQEAMARIAPEGSKLDAKALQFNQVDFMFDADGMTLSGTALGNVGIEFTGR